MSRLSTSSWRSDAAAGRADRHARRDFARARESARQQQPRKFSDASKSSSSAPAISTPQRTLEARLQRGTPRAAGRTSSVEARKLRRCSGADRRKVLVLKVRLEASALNQG